MGRKNPTSGGNGGAQSVTILLSELVISRSMLFSSNSYRPARWLNFNEIEVSCKSSAMIVAAESPMPTGRDIDAATLDY